MSAVSHIICIESDFSPVSSILSIHSSFQMPTLKARFLLHPQPTLLSLPDTQGGIFSTLPSNTVLFSNCPSV